MLKLQLIEKIMDELLQREEEFRIFISELYGNSFHKRSNSELLQILQSI